MKTKMGCQSSPLTQTPVVGQTMRDWAVKSSILAEIFIAAMRAVHAP